MLWARLPKKHCYSTFIRVCSDSCRSETRLPGLLEVFLVVLYAAVMKLYFLFCEELQQLAALFGGCGFELFAFVYMRMLHKSDTDAYTHTQKKPDFSSIEKNSSEITFVKSFHSGRSSCSPTAMSLPRRENKRRRHIYYRLKFSKALLKKKKRGSLTLLAVSMWYLHGCSTLDVYLCFFTRCTSAPADLQSLSNTLIQIYMPDLMLHNYHDRNVSFKSCQTTKNYSSLIFLYSAPILNIPRLATVSL